MDLDIDTEKLQKLTPEERDKAINSLRQQAILLNLQSLVSEVADKCTRKCITAPGTSLSNGEKQCLQRCMDRFIESHNLVSKTWLNVQSSRSSGAGMMFNSESPSFS
uniref:Mitochondrial import inner membrane translocase subunit n=3 Tax=Meloidogyne TaxID=189290 RepID=A0A914LKQ0_MELIC